MIALLQSPAGALLWLLAATLSAGMAAGVGRLRGAGLPDAALVGAALLAVGLLFGILAPNVGSGLLLLAFAAPGGGWPAAAIALAGALLAIVLQPLLALIMPTPGATPTPPTLRLAAGLAAPIVAGLLWPALVQQASNVPLPGVWAMLPGALLGLAFARPYLPAATALAGPAEEPAARPTLQAAPGQWRGAGALAADAAPFLHEPPSTSTSPGGRYDTTWATLGAVAPAPSAMAELDTLAPGHSVLLPDLPGVTTSLVMRTLALHALRRGERVLLILRGPPDRDTLEGWSKLLPEQRDPATIVTGARSLRAALAADRIPAVTVLSIADLASDASVLHPRPDDATRAWLATLGLLLLPELDLGSPLPLTHRMHTLRRVHLGLSRAGATVRVVATGASGGEALRLLQHALPGYPARSIALEPAVRPTVSAWLCDWRFVGAGPEPWVNRVLRVTGPVHVSDPLHQLGGEWRFGTRTSDNIELDGQASVAWMSAAGVAAHAHAMKRVVATGPPAHDSLWALRDDPVTRFLGTGDHLVTLMARGRLAPPQGVFGVHNRGIAREHLRRALSDGAQAAAALRDAFGPSLVDEVVGTEVASWRAVRSPDGRVVRTAIVSARQAPERPLITDAVTDRTTDLVDAASGQTLLTLDEITAPARLYPLRVLQLGADRWEVPLHAHDQRRGRIELRRVEASTPLTLPLLTPHAEPRELAAAPEEVQRGPLAFRLGTFEVLVDEKVVGVLRADRTEVRYPEVSVRYRTRARLVGLDRRSSPTALTHLAASLRGVLEVHLRVGQDDLLVIPVSAGWWSGWPAGVLVIDRNVQGAGVAETLDATRAALALEWVFAILRRCPRERGCASCTPTSVLVTGEIDKAGVLAALGG